MEKIKLLVVIASYGESQIEYLKRIVDEFISFDKEKFEVDLMVHSDIPIHYRDVFVNIIELEDYQYLPYTCREQIIRNQDNYDLFLYTENDMLYTQANIEAWIKCNNALPETLIPGFIQYENSPKGRFYMGLHAHYDFDKDYLVDINGYKLAYLNNEHHAGFLLTKEQLKTLLENHPSLIRPVPDKYYHKNTPKVHVCTLPYTLGPWRKVIPVSHFKSFSIEHLPKKYVKKGWKAKFFSDIRDFIIKSGKSTTRLLRTHIIQDIIKKFGYRDYLEIGVRKGHNFDKIRVPGMKTGVDPNYQATYKETSDDFFEDCRLAFDCIFIDGDHCESQVYKDIINSLECLNDGGTIILHDMLPASEEMQEVPRKVKEWTGNGWKAFVRLRGERNDLEMFTINTDYGIGIIRRGKGKKLRLPKEITYKKFVDRVDYWMSPKSINEFMEWLNNQ